MKRKFISLGLFLLFILASKYNSFSQTEYSLKQCIEYSLKNNSNIKLANYDVEIAKQRVREVEGFYLPNVGFSGSWDNNLIITTTMLPGEMAQRPAGTYIPVKFGTPFNMTGGFNLNQKVYDMGTIYDIRSTKASGELSAQALAKTNEMTAYGISATYYQALIIQIQKKMIETKLSSTEESLKSTQLLFQNGFAKKIDVDKLTVNLNLTKSQLEQISLSYNQVLNNLKFQMGLPQETNIVLNDKELDNFINKPTTIEKVNYNYTNTLDYQMKQTNFTLMELNRKKSLTAFQPTLSFYGNFRMSAYRTEVDFFDPDKDWFNSSAVGLQLNIPIFQGMQRLARLNQAELNLEKAKESLILTENTYKLDISNYEMKYRNAYQNIEIEKQNLELAEGIYNGVLLQYKEGACSTYELQLSENTYTLAQTTYLNRLFDLFIARIDLEKAQGNLMNFINNLK